MKVESHKDLRVWQQSMDLAEHAYRVTSSFPKSETYGLTSQIRRSAVSIPANIAEGYGRESTGAYIQFLKVARGSLRELETHLLLASRLGLAKSQDLEDCISAADNIGRMLHGLITAVLSNSDKSRAS